METVSLFLDFMEKGGCILWAIFVLAISVWWIILERYWYFLCEHPLIKARRLAVWNARTEQVSWYALRQRRQMISEVDCQMIKHLKTIPTLIALLPMFGLLGTVTGMIQVFDVMSFFGSGNPRSMANGVSAATIPTMAGMAVALITIPFAAALDKRYQTELRRLKSAFEVGDET